MTEKKKIDRALKLIAGLSIDKSSQVLSKMIKMGASIEMRDVYMADISQLTANRTAEDEKEVVGAFIDLVGDAPFKFLFYVSADDSLVLTDLILRREVGTSKEFDLYSQSAVQEIGNILASAITNVFATDFQISMRPSPPVVVNDYASTIFQEYIMSAALERDEILIIETVFCVVQQDISCRMFILPMQESEKILNYIVSTM
ncbi:MAG: chemotaxis protein CheC [Candidatus Omnitrophica bacterium]|nr:chemotaxis protein CheC [Candidatus Omnitrophota bacterium]